MQTFHTIIAGCEEGEPAAWLGFLSDYSPAMVQLARIYLGSREEAPALWRAVAVALCAEDFKRLRTFEHQSEREFLAGLRSFLFEQGLSKIEAAPQPIDIPQPTAELVARLVKDLPLLHQEILFFKLAGYSDRTLEQILRITPSVAVKSLDRLQEGLRVLLAKDSDRCLCPAAWLKLQRDLQAAKTEACPGLRRFIRIQDGQVGWAEKEPPERHLASCLHCLGAWTSLREIKYWRSAAPPLPPAEVDQLLSALPIRQESKKAKSFFKGMFR